MLAKEVKIQTLERQKQFLEKRLKEQRKRKNGDPTYIFRGYLYPENRQYFDREGYDIEDVKLTLTETVHIFTPQDTVRLTPEEREESQKYAELKED